MVDSDWEWERLGRLEPYYGVLSDDRFCAKRLEDTTIEEFFESGRQHVDFLFSTIHDHICDNFRPRRALDFGCGVGRVLIPLSLKCDSVVGVDISESMLAEARKNCATRGAENVELQRSSRYSDNLHGKFDFIHSFLVFQHIRAMRGEVLLKRLLSELSEGGIAAIQFACREKRSIFRRVIHRAQNGVPLVHNAANLFRGRSWGFPHMEMNDYDLNRVLTLMYEQGCGRDHVTLKLSNHQGAIGAFFFVRRDSSLA